MRGRIKRFIEDKGYGFITGEDGQDYFFHISQVRDVVEIKNWMVVNFDIVDGKKGKNAVNIRVSEQNNTSRFVTLGDLNIRLNNIKEYSIGTYFIVYKKIFTKTIIKKERKGFLGIKRIKSTPIYKPTSEWHRRYFSLDQKKLQMRCIMNVMGKVLQIWINVIMYIQCKLYVIETRMAIYLWMVMKIGNMLK